MRAPLPMLVGVVAALVAGTAVFGVETHFFPGAEALFGALGALAIGYVAKTLAGLGLRRPAPPVDADSD